MRRFKKTVIAIAVVLFLALVVIIDWSSSSSNEYNPYLNILLNKEQENSLKTIRRINKEGTLYSMDYTSNYYTWWADFMMWVVTKVGCTTFVAQDLDGDNYMFRNYDMPHKDEDGNITGLEVVLKLSPQGKYKSINMVDSAWFNLVGLGYYPGALDNGKTNTTAMILAPYICMDGMNEKGLSCSIMSMDLKEGEKNTKQKEKGKRSIAINQALRYVVDNCATVEEAVDFIKNYNMVNLVGGEYHMLVADASGNSAVFEWRYNDLKVVYSDVATNFYLSSDDACDSYMGGLLKEKYTGPAVTKKEYHYGYGHGYERFKTAVTTLDQYKDSAFDIAVMDIHKAENLLFSCRQTYSGSPDSHTQYSAVYNLSDLSLDIWVLPTYGEKFSFNL